MKVYLDDERTAPEGWVQARWPDEVIAMLQSGNVTELSLDHDLGNDERGTGYDVLVWLEEQVVCYPFLLPVIHVHTANPAARLRMKAAIQSIKNRKSK